MVIWITCLLLYVALYFDVLRKALGFFDGMRLKRRSQG
jgi:hypothetical protein